MWLISFWVFPVVSACMWVAMLIAMLATWVRDGEPIYPCMLNADGTTDGQTVAYISDVGAYGAQPLFITGSVITVVFLDLAFLSERWLRHSGQLAQNKGRLDKICAIASIFFAIAGALGLILLSIFDTAQYPHLHDGFLVMFIGGYLISAILICAEYLRIGLFYRSQHRILLVSFCIKLAFVIIEIALAIAFGICMESSDRAKKNPSAIIEWVIAFVFTGYILSFVIDLLPSIRTRRHIPQGEKRATMAEAHEHLPHASLDEPLTTDSANYYRGARV
ncbi:FK506 suppressor Sfk1 [Penicillium malachiteum]|uniref:FK506 suppressor Sfk1 n=1 Tax=Penicillium malachiteum TaxID=1324776 RepID=A0AAD6HEL7_9EURO|nr:FK506 suppressor Sfk1 [Penicillium malachiteum]